MAVAAPAEVVAVQGAAVVLQLDEVQTSLTQDDDVDFVPLALTVAELDVRPGPIGRGRREELADQPQAFGLVRERRGGHLNPAGRLWHPSSCLLRRLVPNSLKPSLFGP